MERKYVSKSADETFELGIRTAQSLKGGDIVALYGGLGAGKTVFAKGIAKGLEIDEEVVSPTFTIMKEYEGKQKLYHFDLYRIEDEEELMHIGFYEYLDGDAVSVIEWAQNAADLPPCIEVRFIGSGADQRTVEIEGLEE